MSTRKSKGIANQTPGLEDSASPSTFKTLMSCLAKDSKKREKREWAELEKQDKSSKKLRQRLNSEDDEDDAEAEELLHMESSGEEDAEGQPKIQYEDENDMIDSDVDDDLSTVNGSVTTFTPSRSSDAYIAHFGLDLNDSTLSEDSPSLVTTKFAIEQASFLTPGFYHQTKMSRFQVPDNSKSGFKITDAVNLELFPDLRRMKVKQALVNRFQEMNAKYLERLDSPSQIKLGCMTPCQFELFCALNNYIDVFLPKWTLDNADELRLVYCLHVLNHLLKARKMIALNNAGIKSQQKTTKSGVEREFRDRGLTRPKVVILVPFRDTCLKVIQTMWNMLTDEQHLVVSNRKRFMAEYGTAEPQEQQFSSRKPSDFERLFAGNCEDNFRVGLSISKRTVKIFTDFYASDLIIASPLGLMSISPRENPTLPKGVASTEEALYDFLSSVEVLMLDQADVLYMQNWDHVLRVSEKINGMPKQPHDVDFSRVRMWNLSGLAKFYRQTVLLSSIVLPELNAYVSKHFSNRNGRIVVSKLVESGSVNDVVHQQPQLFHRIDNCEDLVSAADKRFAYFTSKVLPRIIDSDIRNTFVFVPSYFDYVRLRNYCKREQSNGLWVSEYTKESHVSRVRSLFFHSKVIFMLYTERLHFFKRYRIRGVRNIVFYSLPSYPHFYSEISNWMADSPPGEACQIVALYSRFDVFQLAGVVGPQMAQRMLSPACADRPIHLFVSGQEAKASNEATTESTKPKKK